MSDKPVFDIGPVVREDGLDIGVPTDRNDAAPHRDLQQVRPRDQKRNDRKTGLVLAIAAIVIAAGALLAVPLLTGNDDQEVAQDDLAPTPTELPATATANSLVGGSAGDVDAPLDGGFKPPSAPHLRADEVAWLFSSRIDTDDAQYGVAYVANDDFVVLDHRGITVPELDIAVDFDTVSNLALLTNNGRTWAINPVDRDLSYLVSNSYIVVVSERPGTIAVIRPENQTQIGLMSSALPVPSVPLPQGAGLLWVQGRGPLVMPRTGGTFEISGLASSLERISDDRAVAASSLGTIYESCDDQLACRYFSQTADGPLISLPFGANTSFDVSPDGAWIVASSNEATSIFDIRSGASVQEFDAGPTAIAWAPDSSFVAIVKDRGLSIFYPATGELVPMQLNQVPDVGSLLVFAS